tara:strand:- start:4559 stop:4741 length:183 start_codon:yes stop_codon:yes gene_type:complete
MNLSNEAMGALMMALQKCIMEQSDITDILKNMKFATGPAQNGKRELFVLNPPVVKFNDEV